MSQLMGTSIHSAPITVEMRIAGEVGSEAFADWICHRARLLDLIGWVKIIDDAEIAVVVTGDEALVEAMEVACSLGPANVLVDYIDCRAIENGQGHNGFTRA